MLGFLISLICPFVKAVPNVNVDFSRVKTTEWKPASKLISIGRTELSAPTEVALYMNTHNRNNLSLNPRPHLYSFVPYIVAETISDVEDVQPDVFALSTSQDFISVTDTYVEKYGLEVETYNERLIPIKDDYKFGGEIKYVVIPQLNIGQLQLFDVVAFVTSSESDMGLSSAADQGDLVIGLSSLNLAYAILPSKGVVRFGPLSEGGSFLNEVGGVQLSYGSSDWEKWTFPHPTKKLKKNSQLVGAHPLMIELKIGEEPQKIQLGSTMSTTQILVNPKLADQSTPEMYFGDLHYKWFSFSAESLDFPSDWVLSYENPFFANPEEISGFLGSSILHRMDFAVDPSSNKISLNPAQDIKYQSLEEKELEFARIVFETQEKDEEEELKASTFYNLANDELDLENYTTALSLYKKSIELEKNHCGYWLNKALTETALNQSKEAIASFEQSSKLFHSWWDRSLDERLEIQKRQAEELEAAETEDEQEELKASGWIEEQSANCVQSDTLKTALYLHTNHENGSIDNDALVSNYKTNLDLDSRLATITGNYALLNGDLALAHEAYRQAIILEKSPLAHNRLGLALYYSDLNQWDHAKPLFEEALTLDRYSRLSLIYYLNNARIHTNPKAVYKWAQRWRATNPDSAAAHYGLVYEAKQQGDERHIEKSIQLADIYFAEYLNGPSYEFILPTYISYLIMVDRMDEAKSLLDSVKKESIGTILEEAEYEAKIGNYEKARELIADPRLMLISLNPALTLLLREESVSAAEPPAAEPPAEEIESNE